MAADGRKPGRWSRLGWFLTLYLVSLAAFAAIVYGLRAMIPH